MEFICDTKRHLVCVPYSKENLHKDHYDIPKLRIDEITKKCRVVSSKEIVRIIQSAQKPPSHDFF